MFGNDLPVVPGTVTGPQWRMQDLADMEVPTTEVGCSTKYLAKF